MNLDNRIVIKCKLNDDIRRLVLHNNYISFNDVSFMIQRIYQLKQVDEFTIKYKDSDGDLISLENDLDVQIALLTCKNLNLVIRLKKEESPMIDTKAILNELKAIQTSISRLIEKFQEKSAKNEPKKPIEREKPPQVVHQPSSIYSYYQAHLSPIQTQSYSNPYSRSPLQMMKYSSVVYQQGYK